MDPSENEALHEKLTAAQDGLREIEARYRLLAEGWVQAVWETDAAGLVTADSPSWRAYTGQTLDEWLGYGWLDAIHPNDRAHAELQWREHMAAGTQVDAEFRLRDPNGGWRWTNVRAAPLVDAGGQIEKWLGLNIDIDARVRAEVALRASEEKYRTLFENMGQGCALGEVIRDEDGQAIDLRYLELNPAFERLSGIPVDQALGRTVREVYGYVEPQWIDVADRDARRKVRERVEYEIGAIGRWFQMHFYPAEGDRYLGLYEDVTERKRAEALLREGADRQSFLLAFSDALRPLADPSAITSVATRLLGEQLDVDRVYYAEWPKGADYAEVRDDYRKSTAASLAGRYPVEAFRSAYDKVAEGKARIVEDNATDPGISPSEREYHQQNGVIAWIDVPLTKGGAPVAVLCVVQDQPRKWTSAEITMCEEAAERCWAAMERGRAEAALRASEKRFQQFADASLSALWIRDAATLKMEYVSPAISQVYGVDPDTFLNGVEAWASSIVPEDRNSALAHLEQARQGGSAVHEFRIHRGSDQAFRWIMSIDFPLYDERGRVERIGGIAEDVTQSKLAVEHQGVLLAELQHRVRNIMAMIRSMVRRSADGAASVEQYQSLLEGRLLALARVQALLTREANTGGSLRDIIHSEISVQAHHVGQFELVGPEVHLSPKAVEVLALALHELSTNALKYGALSVAEGCVRVEWAAFERRGRPWLGIDWIETGAPSREAATRRGFGSDLIEGKIPYELGGTGKISIDPGGAHCRLEFLVRDGESILETDAPIPAAVFGGTLDMTGAPHLTGRRVLVVEDDYYIAGDTAAALRGAGATVLGPCPSEDATLHLLETETPTHAVLDLNLGGGGPQFAIRHELKERGVPFIFLTGYDPDAVPPDLADVVRLQKPVPFRTIVEVVGRL
jgi:PAS domain S-box-containing protein